MNEFEISQLLPLAPRAATRHGWRCPEAARWVAFVEGHVGAGERTQLEAHLADCTDCLGQVGFLARSGELGPAPAVPGPLLDAAREARSRFGFRFVLGPSGLRPLAVTVASGAALALTLVVLQPEWRAVAPGDLRAPESDAVRGVRELSSADNLRIPVAAAGAPRLLRPGEGALVPAGALELEWQAAPEALFYTVQLMSPRGDLLWEARADGTRLVVPPAVPLGSAQPLFAWVVAHRADGAVVRSPLVSFRVVPN